LPAQQTNIAYSTAAVVSSGDILVELILAAKKYNSILHCWEDKAVNQH